MVGLNLLMSTVISLYTENLVSSPHCNAITNIFLTHNCIWKAMSIQNHRPAEFGRDPQRSPGAVSLLEDGSGRAGCSAIYMHWEDHPEPSLLQTKQFQLSQLLLVWKMPQPINYFSGTSQDSPQYVYVSLVLGSPDLDIALQACLTSTEWREEHFPQSASHGLPKAV